MEAKSKIENVNTHGHAFANFLRNNLGLRLRRVKGKGSMLDGGLKGKNKIRQFHFSGSAVWWRQASGDNPTSYLASQSFFLQRKNGLRKNWSEVENI